MIKVAITGYKGRMGQSLIQSAQTDSRIEIGCLLEKGDDLAKNLANFNVLIDFTLPSATLEYLKICQQAGKKMVIGTTGFSEEHFSLINQAADDIAIVYAPNMSVGVNLTLDLLKRASGILGESADVEITEMHHRNKLDAPSGTALRMGEVIADTLGKSLQDCAVYDRHKDYQKRQTNSIGFSAMRGGDVVGEHTVSFFMDGERIEIKHIANSRKNFSNGAIMATKWLENKEKGLYSMEDVLNIK